MSMVLATLYIKILLHYSELDPGNFLSSEFIFVSYQFVQ